MNEICLHCHWLYFSSIILCFGQCVLQHTMTLLQGPKDPVLPTRAKIGIYLLLDIDQSESRGYCFLYNQTLPTVFVQRANLLQLSPFTKYKMGFLDILKEFAGETTIHGLAYMAQSKQSVFRRLTWALLFVIFLIYSTFQLKTAVDCKLE